MSARIYVFRNNKLYKIVFGEKKALYIKEVHIFIQFLIRNLSLSNYI